MLQIGKKSEESRCQKERKINHYKSGYDRKQKKVDLNIEDLAMIYWPIPKKGLIQKLLPKWQGP